MALFFNGHFLRGLRVFFSVVRCADRVTNEVVNVNVNMMCILDHFTEFFMLFFEYMQNIARYFVVQLV